MNQVLTAQRQDPMCKLFYYYFRKTMRLNTMYGHICHTLYYTYTILYTQYYMYIGEIYDQFKD